MFVIVRRHNHQYLKKVKKLIQDAEKMEQENLELQEPIFKL